jgi:hypothetical protein
MRAGLKDLIPFHPANPTCWWGFFTPFFGDFALLATIHLDFRGVVGLKEYNSQGKPFDIAAHQNAQHTRYIILHLSHKYLALEKLLY